MVMTVRPLDHVGPHSKVPRGLPDRDTALHQPSCRRVAEGMGVTFPHRSARVYRVFKGGLDRFDRHTVPFDKSAM